MTKRIGLFIVLGLVFSGFTILDFNSQKKTRNILVIPFNRFEFHTEIELSKLNEINHTQGDQFFSKLSDAFNEAFELNDNPRIFYKVITDKDLEKIRPYLKYNVESGKSHYTCFLDQIDENILQELLDGYDCDYYLTINWYRLMKDRTSYKKNKIKKIMIYSYHYVDYDLFTREIIRIRAASEVKMKVPSTAENAEFLGVRIQDLKPEYKKLVDEISRDILSP